MIFSNKSFKKYYILWFYLFKEHVVNQVEYLGDSSGLTIAFDFSVLNPKVSVLLYYWVDWQVSDYSDTYEYDGFILHIVYEILHV